MTTASRAQALHISPEREAEEAVIWERKHNLEKKKRKNKRNNCLDKLSGFGNTSLQEIPQPHHLSFSVTGYYDGVEVHKELSN